MPTLLYYWGKPLEVKLLEKGAEIGRKNYRERIDNVVKGDIFTGGYLFWEY